MLQDHFKITTAVPGKEQVTVQFSGDDVRYFYALLELYSDRVKFPSMASIMRHLMHKEVDAAIDQEEPIQEETIFMQGK